MDRSSRETPSKTKSLLACALAYLVAGAAACLLGRRFGAAGPITVAAVGDLAATLMVFAASVICDNSSLYDPYWSVAPLFIAGFWLAAQGFPASAGAPRALLALGLLAVWAARLTANWLRRWDGLADEDWRYADLREPSGGAYWFVSFFGFHLFPTVLVFLGCLPLYAVLADAARSLGFLDLAACAVTAFAVWIEARADSELHRFRLGAPPADAVLQTGVWSWSRHPNYLGEVLFWWGLYLFALAANPSWWWTVLGPLGITALFLFVSVPMMERHLAKRRPGYAEASALRPAFFPWPRR